MTKDILLAALLIAVSYLDGVRDKTRDDPKWRKPWFFVPLTGAQVDRHKIAKWLAFYAPLVYIVLHICHWYVVLCAIVLSWLAWQIHPAPPHWRK